MRTARRTGPAVAGPAEVVAALRRRVGRAEALRQGARRGAGDVEDDPVDEVAGIRVVDDQRQRNGSLRSALPGQGRRNVRAVA